MRPLNSDIAGVEIVRLSPLHAVPLEPLQEVLREKGEAVVRIEYVQLTGGEPGPLVHLLRDTVGELLRLVQCFACASDNAPLRDMVKYVDWRLLQLLGPISRREQESAGGLDRQVAIVDAHRLAYPSRCQVVLRGKRKVLRSVLVVVPFREHGPVSTLVQNEWRHPIVVGAVLFTVLIEPERYLRDQRPAPGVCPLQPPGNRIPRCLVVPARHVARAAYNKDRFRLSVANHLSGGDQGRRYATRSVVSYLDVLKPHVLDQPVRAHPAQAVLGVVRRCEVGTRRPYVPHADGASDYTVHFVFGDPGVVKGLLGGDHRPGAQACFQCFVPAPGGR